MPAELQITLLGSPGVALDGRPVTGFVSTKAQALVYYLAATGRSHTRDGLAGLLWSDVPDATARKNLRDVLSNLRRLIGPFLLISRQSACIDPEASVTVDSQRFSALLASAQRPGSSAAPPTLEDMASLSDGVALYQGDFLDGFYVSDAPLFDDWALIERQHLRQALEGALERLVDGLCARGKYKRAIGCAQRWLSLDPLREAAHRSLMHLYAWDDDRAAALRQYETCRQLLADELGVEPSERIQEIHQRLLKGELPIGPSAVEGIRERELRMVGECPYRGLLAFREADAPFFFGRESFAGRLTEAVHTQPMVAVIVGSSGSGKSSAVFAGLLPRLREEGNWVIADLRPGGQPFHALAAALLPALEPELDETDRLVKTRKLAQALSEGDILLYDAVERVLEKGDDTDRLLLLVDQFEELYTLCPEPETRRRFVDALLAAVEAVEQRREPPFVLLLTMRADFMGQALAHRLFADALQEASLMLGPMTREELRAAIEKPAEKQGAALEAGLVERLLDDVGEEPGNLPLLEFALTLLWERLDYGWMTHVAYEEIGGVDGALARYAEEVYGELGQHEQEDARRVFVQLVQPGEETADTRRVAARGELGDETWSLVQHLADKRLVVTGRDPTTGNETVEVVHEALIQRWGQLRDWMEEDRAFRTWQERLRAALSQWKATGEDEGVLLRGAPLAEAEGWLAEREAEMSAGERGFIQASVELRERQAAERQRRRRRIYAGLTAGLIIAVVLALVAVWQRQEALVQASIGLGSQALLELEGPFPERSVLLALEALENYPYTPQAERALGQAVLGDRLRLILRHENGLKGTQWSPDGTRILTASFDGTAQVWDASASSPTYGEKLLTLSGHEDMVWSAVWSSTGDRILTSSGDGTARVWDASASSPTYGEELLRIAGHSELVNAARWSPDGARIVTGSDDGTAKVWDATTGEQLLTLLEHENWVQSAAWSPSGDRIFTASADGIAKEWDAVTGDLIFTFSTHPALNVAIWSRDGSRIVTGSGHGTAKVWDAATGAEILTFSKHKVPIWAAAQSPDGSHIATGGRDAIARVWDPTTGEEILTLRGHTQDINGIAWSPDGTRIVTTSDNGTAKVWDLDPTLFTVAGPEGHLVPVAWSPVDDRVARGFRDGTVKVWNVTTGEEILLLSGHDGVIDIFWSPSGDRIAITGFYDGKAKVWDANTGEELLTFAEPSGDVAGANWSPDGTRIVSVGGGVAARVWDAETGAELFTFTGHDEGIAGALWSPDGRTIASTGDDGAKIWDPTTGQVIRDLYPEDFEYGVYGLAWSPDGAQIAILGEDGVGRVWDVATGEELVTFGGHTGDAWYMEWSCTGERILTSGGDGTARVWDANTGAELLHYEFGSGLVAVWSPDGNRIAVANTDGSLKVLPTWQTTQELIDYAKECCVIRELTAEEREQLGLGSQ